MDLEKFKEKTEKEEPPVHHYYGEYIRNLFFVSGVMILVGIPFFKNVLIGDYAFPLIGIVLIILAGITNKRASFFIFIDMIVSVISVIIFEYLALNLQFSQHPFLILFCQLLAVIFLTSLYYSTRTLRGMLFK